MPETKTQKPANLLDVLARLTPLAPEDQFPEIDDLPPLREIELEDIEESSPAPQPGPTPPSSER